MIEVQCPSCQTRYRIDEGALPQDNPTFKCSRCGHVFSGDPRAVKPPEGPKPPAPVAPVPSPPPARPMVQAKPLQPQSQAQAAAPAQPENPLARSFAEDEPKPNENLSFDFSDDPADDHHLGAAEEEPPVEDRHEDWQVGDVDALSAADQPSHLMAEPAPREPPPPPARRPRTRPAPVEEEEDEAYVPTHSSGFFLMLFALIAVSFAALTLLVGLAPPASRDLLARIPVVGPEFQVHPAVSTQVTLTGVHAIYRRLDDNRTALIVSGSAQNQSDAALHAIQIGVNLVDAQQRALASQAVFCGDIVSPRIAGQMTAHELQFFQQLAPPHNFVLKSGDSAPFLAIFIDPPARSSGFTVGVLKAEPPALDTANAPGV